VLERESANKGSLSKKRAEQSNEKVIEYGRSSVFKGNLADTGEMELVQGMLSHLQPRTTFN